MLDGVVQLDLLWRTALAAIPIAAVAAVLCRFVVRRPAARHMLWLAVLGSFLTPTLVSVSGVSVDPVGAAREAAAWTRDRAGDAAGAWRSFAASRNTAKDGASKAESSETDGGAGATDPEPADSNVDATVERASSPEPPTPAPGASHSNEPVATERAALDADRSRAPEGASGERRRARAERAASPPPAAIAGTSPPDGLDETDRAERAAPATVEAPSSWALWLERVRAVRDAALEVPSPPAALWLGGLGAILLVGAGRLAWERRLTRRAAPVSAETAAMIEGAAREVGLKRAPRAAMVGARISPMIACGARPRLLLPVSLWNDLDDACRRTVLLHELAHLRRRDHWVCWVEAAVSLLYWWHPVVWWARRRLREEADLSCDAWVLALAPGGRRAYADALVRTKQFISAPGGRTPMLGVGMASAGAKRFARRITMVMTQQSRPGLSVVGFALAAALAIAGATVTPAAACDDKAKARAAEACETKGESRAPAPEADPSMSTFERHMASPASDRDDRIGSLEERLERLEQGFEKLLKKLGGERAPDAPARVAAPETPAAPKAPKAPEAPQWRSRGGASAGDVYWLSYQMPEGRLEALWELMKRDDVPVLVRPERDKMGVRGDDEAHATFRAFAKLIAPGEVKVFGEGGDEVAGARGEMHRRHAEAEARARAEAHGQRQRQHADHDRARREHEAKMREMLQRHREEAARMREKARSMHHEARSRVEDRRRIEVEAERIEREAERIEHEAERLFDKADAVFEQADGTDNADAREALVRQAEGMVHQAESLLRRVAELEATMEELEARAERVEVEAERIQEAAEEVEDRAEALAEEAEERASEGADA